MSGRRVIESTRRVIESTRRVIESTCRVIESTRRVVESTCRVIESTCRVIESTRRVIESTCLVLPRPAQQAPCSSLIPAVGLFGIKCAKCGVGFSKTDFVMRVRTQVFHLECFRCVACSRQLIPGDEFALREDGLFCRADHELLERAGTADGMGSPGQGGGRPLQLAAEPMSAAGRHHPLRPHVHKQAEKTTRVRTVLNEKQLHTLRTCYAANPRPDALMKEQLVEMTGLSPRVIRVWFQNKRCKDKKRSILMKQIQQQGGDKTNLQGLTGTPLVAGSPVRQDGPGLPVGAVDVQTFHQPPWKALSDFALSSELDQGPFQQLVNFSEGRPGSNSTGSEITSLSQLPDTPTSIGSSPIEA
ncbi:insulin gene enhancer protein ISL-1-like [Petromyzon marinus]|uniref:insulin gene enhancer protein ISL-1-like n=1 Tax=Petromyzon marinus TaxID=7757 RepID=UPI003F714074